MDLIRKTEALGQAVSDGLLTRDEATQELVAFAEGGLTAVGVEGMIREWTTVRERYAREFQRANDGLKRS